MMNIHEIQIRRWVEGLVRDNQVIEVRRQTSGPWYAGNFNNIDAVLAQLEYFPADNLYTTINTFTDKPVSNQINTKSAAFIGNDDITAIRRLFFDFDPPREPDTPATDAQLKCAVERAVSFRSVLLAKGWPRPALALSGNGAHLMYRIVLNEDLPNVKLYLKRLYAALSLQLSDDAVKFDTAVYNPGRITRFYGSVNHKGISQPDAPHRKSSIQIPQHFDNVPKKLLWDLIVEYGAHETPKTSVTAVHHVGTATGSGDYRTLNVENWLAHSGVLKGKTGSGHLAIRCPWAVEHAGAGKNDGFADAVVFEPRNGGYPGFNCFHDHCAGRDFFSLLNILGGADPFCCASYRGRANG